MINYKIIFLILFLFLNLISHSKSDENFENIAYINIEYVISESIKGKTILSSLNSIKEKNIEILKKQETDIRNLESDISKTKNVISKEDLKKKVTLLNNNIANYNKQKKTMDNDLKKKRNNDIKKFMDEINPILEKFMNDKSINILLDKKNVIMGKKSYNISQQILKIIDTNIK